jgi:CHAT domain-containing protein
MPASNRFANCRRYLRRLTNFAKSAVGWAFRKAKILLGDRATETILKDLSESGRLQDYAVVRFATHGALAGQVQGGG